jgi:hypothetical protein
VGTSNKEMLKPLVDVSLSCAAAAAASSGAAALPAECASGSNTLRSAVASVSQMQKTKLAADVTAAAEAYVNTGDAANTPDTPAGKAAADEVRARARARASACLGALLRRAQRPAGAARLPRMRSPATRLTGPHALGCPLFPPFPAHAAAPRHPHPPSRPFLRTLPRRRAPRRTGRRDLGWRRQGG